MFIVEEVRRNDNSQSWNPVFQKLNLETHKRTEGLTLTAAKSPENRNLNRYRDVLPYDHSRVILDPEGLRPKYINANYVELAEIGHKYILTQGPLPNTCGHFWQMVWEQKSSCIVMLNKILEKNAIKCHPYWPMGESEVAEFGSFRVTNNSETMKSSYITRDFTLENVKTGESRIVKHFHYIMWPDFGVPEDPESFLLFLYDIRKSGTFDTSSGAPIVHCSAGIGRSGTFCLVDTALTKIEKEKSVDNLSIKDLLLELRTQRVGLIQTAEQLRFSYLAIIYGVHRLIPDAFAGLEEDVAENGESEEENEPPPLPPRPAKREDVVVAPHGTKRPNENAVAEEDERQKRMLKQLNNLDDSSDGSEEDEIIDLDASDEDFDDVLAGGSSQTTAASAVPERGQTPPRKPLPLLPPEEDDHITGDDISEAEVPSSSADDASNDAITSTIQKVPETPDCVAEHDATSSAPSLLDPASTAQDTEEPLTSTGAKASDSPTLHHRQRREERKQHTADIVNNIKKNIQAKEQHAASQTMWIKSAIAVGICVGLFAVYKIVV